MNKITELFKIKYPIIQGGMIWNSGYKLASAVSNAGGLGLIGWFYVSRSICANTFRKCKKPLQNLLVNVPMLYPNIEEIIKLYR
jgi:enoyl-[acyl-carrier protein] reductase II